MASSKTMRRLERAVRDAENTASVYCGEYLSALNCGHFAPSLEARERRYRRAQSELDAAKHALAEHVRKAGENG